MPNMCKDMLIFSQFGCHSCNLHHRHHATTHPSSILTKRNDRFSIVISAFENLPTYPKIGYLFWIPPLCVLSFVKRNVSYTDLQAKVHCRKFCNTMFYVSKYHID